MTESRAPPAYGCHVLELNWNSHLQFQSKQQKNAWKIGNVKNVNRTLPAYTIISKETLF
jgi:hypothetical protein